MSEGFHFEYDDLPARRPPRESRVQAFQSRRGWGPWFVICWLGALVSAFLAWQAGEIRYLSLEDTALRKAVAAILVVILVSFPGFALFRLKKLTQGRGWVESRWKPTGLALMALAISFTSAMWSGYLIAIRVARDITI